MGVEIKTNGKGLASKKNRNVIFFNDEGKDDQKNLCILSYLSVLALVAQSPVEGLRSLS